MVEFSFIREKIEETFFRLMELDDEDVISFPMLCKSKNGSIQEAFFVYSLTTNFDCIATPSAPKLWFKIDSNSGTLEFWAKRSEIDFYNASNETIMENKLDFKEYSEGLARIYEIHDIIRKFVFSDSVSQEEKLILDEYKEILSKVVEPKLLPYYNSLGKELFAWIDSVKVDNCKIVKDDSFDVVTDNPFGADDLFGGLDNYFDIKGE